MQTKNNENDVCMKTMVLLRDFYIVPYSNSCTKIVERHCHIPFSSLKQNQTNVRGNTEGKMKKKNRSEKERK